MPINKGIQLEFLKACAHGNYDKVNSIIDSHLENGNIDINEPGELFEVSGDEGHKGKYLSAIQFACLSDAKSNTIIQLLIDKGSFVNIQRDKKNREEMSPLSLAMAHGSSETVEMLRGKGAVFNDYDMDALTACLHFSSIIKKYDIDIDSRLLEEGFTALHLAVIHDDFNAVNRLIKAGANIDIKDNGDYSPIHYAIDRAFCKNINDMNNRGIIDLLTSSGVNLNKVRFHDAGNPKSNCKTIVEKFLTSSIEFTSSTRDEYKVPIKDPACKIMAINCILKNGAMVEKFSGEGKTSPINMSDKEDFVPERWGYLKSVMQESKNLRDLSGSKLNTYLKKSCENGGYYSGQSEMDFLAICMLQKEEGKSVIHSVIDGHNNVNQAKLKAILSTAYKLGVIGELKQRVEQIFDLSLDSMLETGKAEKIDKKTVVFFEAPSRHDLSGVDGGADGGYMTVSPSVVLDEGAAPKGGENHSGYMNIPPSGSASSRTPSPVPQVKNPGTTQPVKSNTNSHGK